MIFNKDTTETLSGLALLGFIGYYTAFTTGAPIPWSRQWNYLAAGNTTLGYPKLPKVHKQFIDVASLLI